jgi:cobalt-zinc-cadmium efflux system membrane fusion protein
MKPVGLSLCVLLLAACSRAPEKPAEPAVEAASANGSARGRTISMTRVAQTQLSIATAPALVQEMAEYLNVTGTVQPVDSRVAHIRPLARGRVEEVLVRVGDRVRRGQVLARFDNLEAGELASAYRAAQAETRKLQVTRQAAARQAERNRKLVELGAAPRKDLEAAQAEEQAAAAALQAQESVMAGLAARLRRFGVDPAAPGPPLSDIAAPIAGIVTAVATAPGEVIDAEEELFTLADISTVWVQAEVFEKDLGRIRTGQSAFVEIDAYPDRWFTASVTYVGDVVDPKTRTVKVRCETPNPAALLKLDMFAGVRLPTPERRRGVAVPESALEQINGRRVVFVRAAGEQFEVRPVTVGMRVNGMAEIVSGLNAGETVVSQGSFHLKSMLLESQIAKEEE